MKAAVGVCTGIFLCLISTLSSTQPTHVADSAYNKSHVDIFFVYGDASQAQIKLARRVGSAARQKFAKILQKGELRSENEMRVTSSYFTYQLCIRSCSAMGEVPTELEVSTSSNYPIRALLDVLNLDRVSSRFLLLPLNRQAEEIRHACLVNELKFQCAYGFLGSAEEIRQHITLMEEADGNFKVMVKRECPLVDSSAGSVEWARDESIYSCMAKSAKRLPKKCWQTILEYNSTKEELNRAISQQFRATVASIEEIGTQIAETASLDPPAQHEAKMQKILKEGDSQMFHTLLRIRAWEASKCVAFSRVERCLIDSIAELCPRGGASISSALVTLLRTGYLTRERGDFLHQHFLESGISPHTLCDRLSK